jgi:hypothetical protein
MEVRLGGMLLTVFMTGGDLAILSRSPPSGPAAGMAGAAGLLGIYFGVGK